MIQLKVDNMGHSDIEHITKILSFKYYSDIKIILKKPSLGIDRGICHD